MDNKRKCIICKKILDDKNITSFCSEKCSLVDLYNWFNEEYFIEKNEDF